MVVVAPPNSGSMMGLNLSELLIGLGFLILPFILLIVVILLFNSKERD